MCFVYTFIKYKLPLCVSYFWNRTFHWFFFKKNTVSYFIMSVPEAEFQCWISQVWRASALFWGGPASPWRSPCPSNGRFVASAFRAQVFRCLFWFPRWTTSRPSFGRSTVHDVPCSYYSAELVLRHGAAPPTSRRETVDFFFFGEPADPDASRSCDLCPKVPVQG